MKRQLTTSGTGNKKGKDSKLAERARITRRAKPGEGRHAGQLLVPGSGGRPSLSLAPESVWTHTLLLTGELDLRSARVLEAEIERLCEEGVTRIVLDLRELARIDAIGVAVIAFRCGHCTRHGYEFSLIAGPPSIQLAFEEAGVLDALPFVASDGRDAAEGAGPGRDDRRPEHATLAELAGGKAASATEQSG